MIDRYDPHFDQDDRFEMRKVLFPAPTEGVWVRWEDHVADTCKLRDKLLELANDCAECHGSGVKTQDGEILDDCPSCLDIRELLA